MDPTTDVDARRAFSGLRERIETVGLFAGDAMALLRDLWHCYRDEAGAASRLAELVEFRVCPECGCDLEVEADRMVEQRKGRL